MYKYFCFEEYQNKYINEHFPYILNDKDLNNFFQGVNKFQSLKYQKNKKLPKLIFEENNVKLLYYENKNSVRDIFLIPSIINKYYILDLKGNKSLSSFLNRKHSIYIIDWSDSDLYSFNQYIEIACSFIKKIRKNNKITVIGYCLGGVIAVAICILMKTYIKNLVLIATPWDFKKLTRVNEHFNIKDYINFSKYITSFNKIPIIFNWLFFIKIYNKEIFDKYIKFGNLSNKSEIKLFLAVEYWLYDSQSLNKNLFHNIVKDFFINNLTYNNKWTVNSKNIDLAKLKLPTLIITAKNDKIVDKKSSEPFKLIKNNIWLNIDSGHIGMIIGRNSRSQLWKPLNEWLERN